MWDFNGENDATRHGRKGPGSTADLVKILSGLYKGEKEDFLHTSPLNGFSMNNPRSWELHRDVEGIQSPTPQPEDPRRSLDPASGEDPDINAELIDGVFHQLSIDNALVAITADYPGLSPASQEVPLRREADPAATDQPGRKSARRTVPGEVANQDSASQAPTPGPEGEASARREPDAPPTEDADRLSATRSEVESAMNHRRRRTVLRDACFSPEALNAFNAGDAHLRAAQDGLTRATEQYVKDIWDLTEKNTHLSQELQECKAQLEAALAAAGGATETPSEGAGLDPDKQHLLRQLKAGEKVLMRVQQERNKLQDANTQLGEELKDVWVQLSDSIKENRRLHRGIYSVLTGRPAEEMPGSTSDLLPELLQLHEHVRQSMSGVVQALWLSVSLPEGLGGLAEKLQGVRQRFRLWKISACRQGTREAWAMVKTRYTKADPNHMAEVGPVGPDGKEIPVSLMYGQIELAAKYS
ncbi:hypothetical protein VPH35_072932 [Triticum aestivum]